MTQEWKDIANRVARLEREREELRAALQECVLSMGWAATVLEVPKHCTFRENIKIAERALSSGERMEGGR